MLVKLENLMQLVASFLNPIIQLIKFMAPYQKHFHCFLLIFRSSSTVNADNIVITEIGMSPSGDGTQFNLHVLDEEGDHILTRDDLLAALNVRNMIIEWFKL